MEILTALGHADTIVVADAGLPVPDGMEQIDLVWKRGDPGFLPSVPLPTVIKKRGCCR